MNVALLTCGRYIDNKSYPLVSVPYVSRKWRDKEVNRKMQRSLHIIMPMAGEGRRFLKEGKTTPKQMGNDKRQLSNDK